MEWQPIETAPLDGTAIMIFKDLSDDLKENGLVQGTKVGESICMGIAVWLVGDHEDYWADYYDYDKLMTSPTHWMPLPEPPK